jgi:hypothetical protein
VFRIVVTVSAQIEGPDLTSGAFLLGRSRGAASMLFLSLAAVCSRNTASTYRGTRSTTRDGKVHATATGDMQGFVASADSSHVRPTGSYVRRGLPALSRSRLVGRLGKTTECSLIQVPFRI